MYLTVNWAGVLYSSW